MGRALPPGSPGLLEESTSWGSARSVLSPGCYLETALGPWRPLEPSLKPVVSLVLLSAETESPKAGCRHGGARTLALLRVQPSHGHILWVRSKHRPP